MKHLLFSIFMKICYILPKPIAHKLLYFVVMKKRLNYKNVNTLNEKLHYLMVYKYGKNESLYVDKEYVKEIILKMNIPDLYIPKTYKVYSDAKNINVSDLPEKFVLKCNHGSGKVYICTDKKNFDIEKIKIELNKTLKEDYSKKALEYHYKYINPVIIAEEYLNDGTNGRPLDYKFFCYSGDVGSILVCNPKSGTLKRNDFDTNWNKLDYCFEEYRNDEIIKKPKNLNKMINIASILSKKFPFVRVDLYNINGKIFFGELTFSPSAGLTKVYNQEGQIKLGEKIDLSKY